MNRSSSLPPDSAAARWDRWWSLIGITLVSFLVSFLLYGQSIKGDFVYDDVIFLSRKDLQSQKALLTSVWFTRTTSNGQANEGYRPLSMISYVGQFVLFGKNPAAFHAANIVFHAINTILVYCLVQQLYGSGMMAWIAALLFLFLPIHSENVAAIKYREDMLASLWMIISWIAFLRGAAATRTKKWLWYGLSAGGYLACLLSKELLLLSPLFIWLLRLVQLPRGWRSVWQSLGVCALVFGLPLGVYAGLRIWVYGIHGVDVTVSQQLFNPLVGNDALTYIATSGKIFFTYVAKTIVPYHLSANYAYNHFPIVSQPFASWESLAGLVLFGAAIVVAYRYRRTPVGLGAIVFLVCYIPLSKIVLQSADIFAERWMYFPSIGIVLPIAWYISYLYKKYHYVVLFIFLIVLGWYSVVILPRAVIWKNPGTLYDAMLQDAPDSAWVQFSAGNYYLNTKKVDLAEAHAKKSLQILPDMYEGIELMGEISGYRGDYDRAEGYFQQAIKINPKNNVAHLNYALSLAKQKKYLESMQYVAQEFIDNPHDPKLRYVMAVDFYKLGHYDKAKYFFDWDLEMPFEKKIQLLESF